MQLFKIICALLVLKLCNASNECNIFESQIQNVNLTHVKGISIPAYLPLVYEFESSFLEGSETGASVCVYYRGCKVLDIWGGEKDEGEPWQYDTLTNTFSASKGLLAVVVAVLEDQGLLDYNEKVSTYWPAFAQGGKGDVTVEQLVSHAAGLPAVADIDFNQTLNHAFVDSIIEPTNPIWPPGVLYGYHPITIGWWVDGLVRHVDPQGRDVEQIVREEILPKIDEGEVHYSPDSSLDSRIALLTNDTTKFLFDLFISILPPGSLFHQIIVNPPQVANAFAYNNPTLRRMYSPGSHLYTTARTLAAIYGNMAFKGNSQNGKILSNPALKNATEQVHFGVDVITGSNTASYTRAGFENPTDDAFSENVLDSFGRSGLGGQMAWANSKESLGFAYLTRNLYFAGGTDNTNLVNLIGSNNGITDNPIPRRLSKKAKMCALSI